MPQTALNPDDFTLVEDAPRPDDFTLVADPNDFELVASPETPSLRAGLDTPAPARSTVPPQPSLSALPPSAVQPEGVSPTDTLTARAAVERQDKQQELQDVGQITLEGLNEIPKLRSAELQTLGIPKTAADIAAGAQQAMAGVVDFFMTPAGMATVGLGVAKTGAGLVNTVFKAEMAAQVPEIGKRIGESLAEGDTEAAAREIGSGILNAIFIAHGLKPGEKGPPSPAVERSAIEALRIKDAAEAVAVPKNPITPVLVENVAKVAPETAKALTEVAKSPEVPEVVMPYNKESIKSAFNLTDEQAEATDAIVKSMGLDESRIQVAKGGTAAPESLTQEGVPSGFWVSPDGQLYTVHLYEHEFKAKEILGSKFKESEGVSEYQIEKKMGFARAVYDRGSNTMLVDKGTPLTRSQESELKDWAIENKVNVMFGRDTSRSGGGVKREIHRADDGILYQGKKGATEFASDGKAIIRGFASADVSTGIHEIAHVARRQLFDSNLKPEQRAGITDSDISTAETWAGAKDGVWDRPAEEKFARGFERYLSDGKAPSISLKEIFSKFKDWLTGIYQKLSGSPVNIRISSEMRQVFDRLVTRRFVDKAVNVAEAKTAQDKAQANLFAGPGGTIRSDVGVAKSELNQFVESLPDLKGKSPRSEGTRVADVKDSIRSGLSAVKTAFDSTVEFLKNPPKFTSFEKAIGVWSRMRQESGRDAYFAWKKVKKQIPDIYTRDAIGAFVDAGGNRAVMEKAAVELPERYARVYRRALTLTPEEIKISENTRSYFDKRLEDAQNAGILEDGVENYIRRVFKDPSESDFAALQFQLLSTAKPGFAKQRVFETDIDAIRAGFKPIQDFAQRTLIYDQELNRAIADRHIVKTLMEREMPDGRPMIDVGGVGMKIEGKDATDPGALLIKPQFKPTDKTNPKNHRADYKAFNHPAFRKWKWVVEQDGKQVLVQGDVLVHPKAYESMLKLLERSRVKSHILGGAALKVSSIVKQTMLDLSGFHQVQIGVHAAEHRVIPSKTVGNLVEIDLKDATQRALVEHGLTVFEESGFIDFSEGLHGHSIVSKIPGLGALTGAYHNWLFKEFIPSIKMTMATHALERNAKVYPKLSRDQLLRLTAEQANAAFGGQNWKMLGRSETEVDLLRLSFLAPDFLISRMKFVGQAGTPLGREQLAALLLGAATLYTTARVANTLISGNPHNEKESLFSIVYKGHSYSLRTIQGDVLHLIAKPGQFWYHRVNPVTVQPLIEAVTGRNYFGTKVDLADIALDQLTKPLPISLKGLIGGSDQNLIESSLNAFGIQTKRFSSASAAYALAKDWKEKNGVKGEPGEFIYDPTKDPLHVLKSALQYQDTQRASEEIKRLLDSKEYTTGKLNSYFARYANAPFTGSRANEAKFLKSLSESELKTIKDAKEQRASILKQFKAALTLVK